MSRQEQGLASRAVDKLPKSAKPFRMSPEDTLAPAAPPCPADPAPGHNRFADVVWERKTKHRIFVRALEGTYGNLVKELFEQPRVYKTRDLSGKAGRRATARRSSTRRR